jgi:hypothetical protein
VPSTKRRGRMRSPSVVLRSPTLLQPTSMAFMLPGLRRGLMLSSPLILATPLLLRHANRPMLCDGPDPLTKITSDLRNTHARESQSPVILQSGAPNPKVVRQISMGSILGVLGGMGVSVFSKPLAILLGLGIVLVQVCDSSCHFVNSVLVGYLPSPCYAPTLCTLFSNCLCPSMTIMVEENKG